MASQLVREAFLVHLAFDTTPLYINTTPSTIVWNGENYMGAGILGEISPPVQNIDMSAGGVDLRLSGVPVDKIIDARAERYRNRNAYIYYANFGPNWELEGEPLLVFSGQMDTVNIASSNTTASITVSVKSELAEWQRAKTYRYTNEMQRERYPNDLGLEYVAKQKDNILPWGVK